MRERILLLLLLPICLSSAQPELSIRVYPSELVVSPGDRVQVRIVVRNDYNVEVNLTGFELRVVQYFPLIPSGIQVGTYEMPLEEPLRLRPGEEREIVRVFEVPSLAYSGEFSVFLKAKSTAGDSLTEVKVSLGLPLSSALSMALALLVEAAVIYGIYMVLRRRLRPEHPVRRRLRRLRSVRRWREYDREVVDLISERRSWGTYEDEERYERHVRAVKKAEHLIRVVIDDLREERRRIWRELNLMRAELAELRGVLSEESLEYVERLLRERGKMLEEIDSLIDELERSVGAEYPYS